MKLNKPAGSFGTIAVVTALLAVATLFLSSCQKATCASCNFSQLNSQSTGGTPPPIQGTFTVSAGTLTPFTLATNQTITVTVTADANFSGAVNLAVSEPELSAIDKAQYIKFTFTPSSVTLSPNGSATAQLKVDVPSMAPDFSSSLFHVVGSGGGYVNAAAVSLSVQPVYNVYIKNNGGTIPENWTLAAKSSVSFQPHSSGLTVSFVNLDTAQQHIIHSTGTNGTIPHQNTGMPLTVSADGVTPSAGGTYTNVVTSTTMNTSVQVYCHTHESSTQARTLIFNVPPPTPSPSPSPTPNPNATFTYINTNVFVPQCVSCHTNGNASGGVNLNSYNNVFTTAVVTPGVAATSPLYNAVAGGSMPKGGTPLSAALIKDIQDWINAGAPNN